MLQTNKASSLGTYICLYHKICICESYLSVISIHSTILVLKASLKMAGGALHGRAAEAPATAGGRELTLSILGLIKEPCRHVCHENYMGRSAWVTPPSGRPSPPAIATASSVC